MPWPRAAVKGVTPRPESAVVASRKAPCRHTLMRTRGGAHGDQGVRAGHGISGRDGTNRRRVVAGLAAPAAGQAGVAQRALHRPRRHRLRAPRLLRLADPDAESGPARRRRPALQQHAHHRALLAQPVLHADRPQPPFERDGVHHRGRDRLPGLERPDPVRERVPVGDAAGARLQHDGAREMAPHPDRAVQPGRPLRSLAARARLRALLRLHGRRHQPVLPGPGLRQPPGPAAAHPRAGVSPDRGSGRSRDRVRRRRQAGRARQAVLHVLLHGRDARAPPRAARVGGQVQGTVRRRLGRVPAEGVRAPARARHPAGRHEAVRARSRRRGLGQPRRRREAPLRPDDGGVRGLPRAHRPSHRAPDRLPRTDAAARRHAGDGDQRQRRQRRGRPARLGQREPVLQQRPRDAGGEPEGDRRPGRAEVLQPLPVGLGVGGQHAVPPLEARDLPRRRRRSVHRPLAGAHQGQGRGARPVRAHHRHGADGAGRARPRRRRPPSAASRSHRSRACRSPTRSPTPRPRPATTPSTSR